MLEAKALEEHIQAPIEEQPPKKQKRKNNKTSEIATNPTDSRNDEGEAQHSRNDDLGHNDARENRKTIFFDCVHLVYVGEREYLLSNAKGQRVKLQKGDEIILPKGDTERYLLYKGLFKRVWSDS